MTPELPVPPDELPRQPVVISIVTTVGAALELDELIEELELEELEELEELDVSMLETLDTSDALDMELATELDTELALDKELDARDELGLSLLPPLPPQAVRAESVIASNRGFLILLINMGVASLSIIVGCKSIGR